MRAKQKNQARFYQESKKNEVDESGVLFYER
jgi:hypothetical protein